MTLSVRKNRIPKNIILFSTSTVPACFVHECRLDGKFAVGVPNNCTNPGTSVGSATHQHASAGSHSHTVTTTNHTHTKASGGPSATADWDCSASCDSGSRSTHTHTSTSASTSPSVTSCSGGAHQHNLLCNNPAHKTLRHIRYSPTSLPIRTNNLNRNVLMLWTEPLCAIPTNLSLDSNHYGKYLKQTPNTCTSPGTTAGCNAHTHSCSAAHTHNTVTPVHSHTQTSVSGSSFNSGTFTFSGCGSKGSHTHTGSATFANSSSTCVVSGNPSVAHNHSSDSLEPLNFTVGLLSQNSVSLRKNGLAYKAVGLWLESLASIPFGFANSDGVAGRPNILSKVPKVIPCGCTNPGTSGGNATHAHSSGGAHTHTVAVSHTHPMSGSLNAASAATHSGLVTPNALASKTHTHTFTGSSATGNLCGTLSTPAGHSHPSSCNLPASVEVAFIQKV